MAYKRDYFTNVIRLYAGMNINDTPDKVSEKGQAEYILNCYSTPENAIARLFGRSKHNSVTVGIAAEITGIYELKIETPAFFCIAEAKFYKDSAGTWGDKTGAISITDNKNNLWQFSKFSDVLIGTGLSRNAAIEHDGGAGNLANVSNMPAVKFNVPFKNRIMAYNTAAQPKLGYWCAINDRTSWDTANNYLNFKGSEADDEDISGASGHLDNIIVGKRTSIYRQYHTGTEPPFKYYKIDNIGVSANFTMQSIPAAGIYPARLIWMGYDNFYQLIGDSVSAIGDDIKPFFSEGAPFQINLSRLEYCVSGVIKEKNLYLCSFSSGSSETHDKCFVLDYKNMMWAICDFPINSFGLRTISGREFLYSGTYTGFVCKHDPAVYNNLGSAYTSIYISSWIDFGDTQKEKKVRYLIALMQAVGDFDLQVEYRTNLVSDWVNLGYFNSSPGGALLGIDWTLGTSKLGGADLTESILEVLKRFKRIKLRFTQATLNQYFRLYALGIMYQGMPGYRIGA